MGHFEILFQSGSEQLSMNVILHTGVEHPNLLWIVLTAILTFTVGAGAGIYFLRRKRGFASEADAADA